MVFALFLKGVVVGVVIAIPVGPVGILCMRRALFQGRIAGLVSGFGAASADALFGVIAAFGFTAVSAWLFDYREWLRLAAAAFLLYLGTVAVRAPPPLGPPTPRRRESLLTDFASTFALTITNPVTLFVFIAVFAGIGLSGAQLTFLRALILVAGVWIGSLLWWLLLSFAAATFSRLVEPHHLQWINRGSGSVLLICGIALFAVFLYMHLA
jgi:threonine/homoserine/homoserine lactone efflux protein